MVVAQVVRICNQTNRTFNVEPGGSIFSSPRVDDLPCEEGIIEVPPGFDQCVSGLVVPWATLTSVGLVIADVETKALLRCVVGPRSDDEEDRDWLQLHSSSWEPLAAHRWVTVGKRHLLGTVGSSSDWQLTFRDSKQLNSAIPSEDDGLEHSLHQLVHFESQVSVAERNRVFLNVFDLAQSVSIPNAVLCNTVFSTFGAFHAAVEVYGEEWSFYRTPNPSTCGVCKSRAPRNHPVHVYRQSIDMGTTQLKEWEVRYLIRAKLATNWPGGGYDLLSRNCIHFCDELLLCLGVERVPSFVRGLHETGHAILRVPWPLSNLLGGSDAEESGVETITDIYGEKDNRDNESQQPTTASSSRDSTSRSASSNTSYQAGQPRPSFGLGQPPPGANFIENETTAQ